MPYRGTAPSVNDLIAGQIDATFTGAPAVLPHVKSGRLRALAVSQPRAHAALPDVPTVAESGFAGFEADQWYGIVAPAGTPRDDCCEAQRADQHGAECARTQARLSSEGAVATPTTPEAFGKHIASEIARWKPVIQSGRVKTD